MATVLFSLGLVAGGAASARAQVTMRVSVDSAGAEADGDSRTPVLSADGRFVAFASAATNLVANDLNGCDDVFVHDGLTGATEIVSIDSVRTQGNGASSVPSISGDGRFVVFLSNASNLVAHDRNRYADVFVRDRLYNSTELVSVNSNGGQADAVSFDPAISADGRFVVFQSNADNLVPGDTNLDTDVFVRDLQAGTTERASVDSKGTQGNGDSYAAAVSADGRFVAFRSAANNLVLSDTNGTWDVFVRDRQAGTTERVSVDSSGAQADGESHHPALSADGSLVAFYSYATNLVAGDGNGAIDVFVRDRQTGTTERISVDSAGGEGDGDSRHPSISGDGRYVVFESSATNLIANDGNGTWDVFVHDRVGGNTQRLSESTGGGEGDDRSLAPQISPDGRFTTFSSRATDLVASDLNGDTDVFTSGRPLTLEVDATLAIAGAHLRFSTWTGNPIGACALVVSGINGFPVFQPALFATFDAQGEWLLPATVPPGLAGNAITFETVGYVATGKVDLSNPFTVTFL